VAGLSEGYHDGLFSYRCRVVVICEQHYMENAPNMMMTMMIIIIISNSRQRWSHIL